MRQLFRGILQRFTSKSFIASFVLVTALCITDLTVFSLAKQYGINLPYGSALSYGMIFGLYSICVIECLGLSFLAKFGREAAVRFKDF